MHQAQYEKDWTVLIYANGNNELKPEIGQAKIVFREVAIVVH